MARGHSLEWEFQNAGITYAGGRFRSDTAGAGLGTGLIQDDQGTKIVSIDATPGVTTEKTLFRVAPNSSAVNNIVAKGSATGTGLRLEAEGSDANVDIGLFPKAGGVVQIGMALTSGTFTATHFIYLKDLNGTIFQVAGRPV
jgi:hypothetical protein